MLDSLLESGAAAAEALALDEFLRDGDDARSKILTLEFPFEVEEKSGGGSHKRTVDELLIRRLTAGEWETLIAADRVEQMFVEARKMVAKWNELPPKRLQDDLDAEDLLRVMETLKRFLSRRAATTKD